MLEFNLYRAECLGNPKNCRYPEKITVKDAESLRKACRKDYVAVAYAGGYRKEENFRKTDCLAMDCDNDHSENPRDWITPEMIREMLPDVTMGVHYSRNHNKEKNGKSARPRFHCFFRIDEMTDAKAYSELKKQVNQLFPFFDSKALDAARFFFGTEKPEVEFQPGKISLNECLEMYYPEDPFAELPDPRAIPQGSRNSTMHTTAIRAMKRFGVTEDAKRAFLETAEKCDPPLDKEELKSIWNSAKKFYRGTIAKDPNYVPPAVAGNGGPGKAEKDGIDPIPFSRFTTLPFPTDALPKDIAEYVAAVAESTQTPVDMAGTVALSILSVCLQGKYRVQGKADWLEPLNTYALVIATPSERKSAVLNMMLRPINNYETQYNQRNAASMESSRMKKRILERKQKNIEDLIAKGKANDEDMADIAAKIAEFQEEQPLQLYVDDITTEKLVSVIAANKGKAALISSEGGIFDTLAGIYTNNVNIDVMLKGYSGDPIRVDRIGRDSESVMSPALTVLLMAQPNVVSTVLSNTTFRGRGLTARFLYCMPESQVGSRKFNSQPVTAEIAKRYDQKIINLLDDDHGSEPQTIKLTAEASKMLTAYADDLEPKLSAEYAHIGDWAGKLVGNILRIAGLLGRAEVYLTRDFLGDPDEIQVDRRIMENAIQLGNYYLSNALTAFDVLPTKPLHIQADYILEMIRKKKLVTFDRRFAMRNCKIFKTVAEIQPVLDFLEDYGYIFEVPMAAKPLTGRPPLPKYNVNPKAIG